MCALSRSPLMHCSFSRTYSIFCTALTTRATAPPRTPTRRPVCQRIASSLRHHHHTVATLEENTRLRQHIRGLEGRLARTSQLSQHADEAGRDLAAAQLRIQCVQPASHTTSVLAPKYMHRELEADISDNTAHAVQCEREIARLKHAFVDDQQRQQRTIEVHRYVVKIAPDRCDDINRRCGATRMPPHRPRTHCSCHTRGPCRVWRDV